MPVATGIIGGILLDHAWAVPWTCAAVLLVLGGGMLIAGWRVDVIRAGAVAMTSAAVGCVLHENAYRRIPANHVVRYTGNEPVLIRLTGTVTAEPVVREIEGGHFARWIPGRTRTRLCVQADEVAGLDGPIVVCGLVQVNVHEPIFHLTAGDRVRIIGRLYRPLPPSNPGQYDWAAFLRRQGILAAMQCKYAAAVLRMNQDTPAATAGFVDRLRVRLRGLLHEQASGDEETASLLDALVLGQRSAVSREINQAFVRTGTVHFLSVSGTHVGVLALFVWWLLGVLGLSRPVSAMVVLAVVMTYVAVAEPCVPILRTGIVCALGCVAVGLRRPMSSANWLAAAVIVLLAWRPCDLFAADFQLSFGIVLSLFLLCPGVLRAFQHLFERWRRVPVELSDDALQQSAWRQYRDRFVRSLLVLASTSVTAWLVGSAITAYHFRQVSIWGWLNSLLVWPVAMLVVIGGFLKVLLATVWPATTVVTGPLLGWSTVLLTKSVLWLDKLPWVRLECPSPPGWCLTTYLGGLAAAAILWRLGMRMWWVATASLVPVVCVAVWWVHLFDRRDELTLWALSVGSGQAVLLQLPGGEDIVCDVGTRSGYDVGRSVVVPAFRSLGVRRVRQAVISHANFDHYGGLLDVADGFGLGTVFVSPQFVEHARQGGAGHFLLDELARRGVAVRHVCAGDRIELAAPVLMDVLWPPEQPTARWSPNDCSVVLRVRHAGRSILICGDIGSEPQRRLIERGDLRSDLLVLPHHGSVATTTADFIHAVDPSVVIRSGGRSPGENVSLTSLLRGRGYYDTARNGAIEVTVRKDGLSVRTPFGRPTGGLSGQEPDDTP